MGVWPQTRLAECHQSWRMLGAELSVRIMEDAGSRALREDHDPAKFLIWPSGTGFELLAFHIYRESIYDGTCKFGVTSL